MSPRRKAMASSSPCAPARARMRARLRWRAWTREAHYMASLLRNLGTAATLDDADHRGESDRHPVDISALVDRVVARHRPLARAGQIDLNHAVPDVPVVTVADVTLFEQAVS